MLVPVTWMKSLEDAVDVEQFLRLDDDEQNRSLEATRDDDDEIP